MSTLLLRTETGRIALAALLATLTAYAPVVAAASVAAALGTWAAHTTHRRLGVPPAQFYAVAVLAALAVLTLLSGPDTHLIYSVHTGNKGGVV